MTNKQVLLRADLVNPFLGAACDVFSTMLFCELERGKPYLKEGSQPEHDISGIIELSGKAQGTVLLSLERAVALQAAAAMTGEEHASIDDDVRDVVGELANMVAGQSKAQLEKLELTISPPKVVSGKNHIVGFPECAQPIGIPYTCAWGALSVEFGLTEE